MLQNIIAYLIIFLALSNLIYKILRFFNLTGKQSINSSKCGGCTSGCEMKEIHLLRKNNSIKNDPVRMSL